MRRWVSIALAGAALTLIAFMFAAAPLFVPGVAFTLIGIGAPAWVRIAAHGGGVRRRLSSSRVIEGERFEATLEVSTPWLVLAAAEVIEPLRPARLSIPAGRRADTIYLTHTSPRRGRHQIEPPTLVVRDILELAQREIAGHDSASELLVLPRTSAVRALSSAGLGRSGEAAGARAEALAAVDLDGLQPYRPGTPAARIHWPALARGAGLIERRLRTETDTQPLVVLDARGAALPEHLDQAVRAAASLVLALARAGGCGLLLPGERRPASIGPELGGWPAAHARLAVVEGGRGCPAPALGGARVRLGPVFYVAAQALERLPPAVYGIARGAGVIVLPAALNGPVGSSQRPLAASFEVAECFGYVTRTRARQRGARPVLRPAATNGAGGG